MTSAHTSPAHHASQKIARSGALLHSIAHWIAEFDREFRMTQTRIHKRSDTF